MNDALAAEATALSFRAETARERVKRHVRRIAIRLGMQDHYRRVFCDQATGQLTDSAVAVLRDLAKQANFGRDDRAASDAALRENHGARRLLLHLHARLDLGSDELLDLAKRMRETTNDRSEP
jgi:hypothetical protein